MVSVTTKATSILVSAAIILSGSGVAYAAPATPVQADALSTYFERVEKVSSAKYEYETSFLAYEEDEEDPLYGAIVNAKGSYSIQKNGSTNSKGVGTQVTGTNKRADTIGMEAIVSGEFLYIRFKDAANGALRGKWIQIPLEDVPAVAQASGLTALMEATASVGYSEGDTSFIEESSTLAEKHDLYEVYEGPVSEKEKGKTLLRYDFGYNPEAVAPYFAELKRNMDPDEVAGSIFGIEGFDKGIKNPFFVDGIVDESYGSVWFDAKTGLPARFLTVTVVPAFGDRDEEIHVLTFVDLKDVNKKVSVKAPAKFITMERGLQMMGVELD